VLRHATQHFIVLSGFCDELPGGHGGPARRRALELHILACFDASVIWSNCGNYIMLMMLSLTCLNVDLTGV